MDRTIKNKKNQKIFQKLMRGHIISLNSLKDKEYTNYLLNEENSKELNDALEIIGFKIINEDRYFFLTKLYMTESEKEEFLQHHKRKLLAILFLKKVITDLRPSREISKDEFVKNLKIDQNRKLIKMLFDNIGNNFSAIDVANKLFNLLAKQEHILEKHKNKDEYKILDSINYYFDIIEKMNIDEDEEDEDLAEENKNCIENTNTDTNNNKEKGEENEKNLFF
jgi:hypothetical protein